MNFNDHSRLLGEHAFLSASKYHWLNYDETKLALTYSRFQAAQRGSELHEFAQRAIQLGIKLPKTRKTLNMYVNDAIGFKMHTEVVLFYSENCFGTADAVAFRDNTLRVHDLKNGISPTSMNQLMIYAALFCLEYGVSPDSINIELRIYQLDDVLVYVPAYEEILAVMDKIILLDKWLEELKLRG